MASQQLVPAVINALINGGIAWGMHRGTASLPLWGDGGYATDLLATGVLLPGITWLIMHPLLHRQAAAGKAPSTDGVPPPWLAARLPATLWAGSAAIGLAGLAVGAAACALAQGLGAPSFAGTTYALVKGLYGGLLPVLLQPAMVFAILREAPSAVAGAAPTRS